MISVSSYISEFAIKLKQREWDCGFQRVFFSLVFNGLLKSTEQSFALIMFQSSIIAWETEEQSYFKITFLMGISQSHNLLNSQTSATMANTVHKLNQDNKLQ